MASAECIISLFWNSPPVMPRSLDVCYSAFRLVPGTDIERLPRRALVAVLAQHAGWSCLQYFSEEMKSKLLVHGMQESLEPRACGET